MMNPSKLLICALLALALFGCLSQNVPPSENMSKEQLGKELGNATITAQPGLVTSSDQGVIQVVTIRATNASGRWRFPMQDYNDEFLFAGLYSDSFVKLNKSQIRWLDDGESIWLTIMRGNGSGVLFNAIYSNEMNDCGTGGIRILGKNYTHVQLKNGSSFGSDDKWKVAIESSGGCTKRVVIYLDGYFDGLKDGEQINLFRNDNTVLLEFVDLDKEPKVRVVTTRPTVFGQAANTQTVTGDMKKIDHIFYTTTDRWTGHSYNETQELDEKTFTISFDPSIPMYSDSSYCWNFEQLAENHDLIIWAGHNNWSLVKLRKKGAAIPVFKLTGGPPGLTWDSYIEENVTLGSDELVLAKSVQEMASNACENVTIGNENYSLGVGQGFTYLHEIPVECNGVSQPHPLRTNASIEFNETDSLQQVNGKWVHLTHISPVDAAWASFAIYDEIVDVAEGDGVSMAWEDGTSEDGCGNRFSNPKLRSISVPRPSPIFEKLTG